MYYGVATKSTIMHIHFTFILETQTAQTWTAGYNKNGPETDNWKEKASWIYLKVNISRYEGYLLKN